MIYINKPKCNLGSTNTIKYISPQGKFKLKCKDFDKFETYDIDIKKIETVKLLNENKKLLEKYIEQVNKLNITLKENFMKRLSNINNGKRKKNINVKVEIKTLPKLNEEKNKIIKDIILKSSIINDIKNYIKILNELNENKQNEIYYKKIIKFT